MEKSIQHTMKEVARLTGRSSFAYQVAERGSKPANLIGWDLTSTALQT